MIAFARSVPASDFHQANDVIVIANIAPEPQSQALELGELVGEYTDWFSQAKVSLDEGQVMELEGNSYQVLVRSR